MKLRDLIASLRPAGQSAADVDDALIRTRGAVETAEANMNAAAAARNRLLLDGNPDELEAAEAELRDRTADVARVQAMEGQLTVKLNEARRAEALAERDAAVAEANGLHDAILAFADSDVPKINALGKKGLALVQAHEEARSRANSLARSFALAFPSAPQNERVREFDVMDMRMRQVLGGVTIAAGMGRS